MVEFLPLAVEGLQAIFNKKGADKAASAVSNLQYQPIDLKALQEQARATAEQNARNSLALERSVSPDLADARAGSQKMVAEDLKKGGQLPLDVTNAVTSAGIAQGNEAGLYGGAGPITAAQLGLTSLDLRNQRLSRALQLTQANQLPEAGIDPGALASATIANKNAENQFNLSKAGAQTKAAQSKADATGGLLGAAANIAGKIFGGS